MTSDKLAGQEYSTPGQVYQLSEDEIASLRKEMQASGQWMVQELKRRRPCSVEHAILDRDQMNESPMPGAQQ